ncbi:Bug family tripartite tricarboxylate transporter substrate binding protein [Hydrogenophaga sp. BPS33]|uniref:Bug family tripartite tricarboxylate transporter substrate binding protein n=1 Tax=Hydrogenophaga sp. BPS33 TaxID=2651974 RepID=UPI00135CC10D|nr:tripartite tricarboxylate transporter substrate binding protein [Hydrogenophaga sp. BPS33]
MMFEHMNPPRARARASRSERGWAAARRLLCAAVVAVAPLWAGAQGAYPDKPIKLMVGYPPGGGTDILARLIGPKLAAELGQPVVIENRSGATGTIAAGLVAKAPPDGYTLLLGTNASNALAPAVIASLSYDPRSDFAPVAMLASVPQMISVAADSPFKTLGEFMAHAKANPGQLFYGTPGNGSAPHLAGRLFETTTGITLMHVPYRGAGHAITDMIGGRTHVSFESASSSSALIRSGRIRALAVAAPQRLPQFPDVPTTSQAGLQGYEVSVWFGLFAPKGTPQAIVRRLHTAVNRALAPSDVQAQIANAMASGVWTPMEPREFSGFVVSEVDRYMRVAKQAGIVPE